jgi:hypothetical protein
MVQRGHLPVRPNRGRSVEIRNGHPVFWHACIDDRLSRWIGRVIRFIAKAKVKPMKKNQQNPTESTVDLTAKKTKVITALIRGATVSDATRQASIDRSTYYLWVKSDEAWARSAVKRGGEARKLAHSSAIDFDEIADLSSQRTHELIAIDDALASLAQI